MSDLSPVASDSSSDEEWYVILRETKHQMTNKDGESKPFVEIQKVKRGEKSSYVVRGGPFETGEEAEIRRAKVDKQIRAEYFRKAR